MKKTFLILTVLMISLSSVKGQNPFYTCVINFEDNPCEEASYNEVNIPFSNNIWQVCIPSKTVFDNAHSFPKAILTDSVGSYPINTTSSFTIKFVLQGYCMCAPVIGGFYKFDSDTLKDFGRIEFSVDHGTTWLNALSDTVIPDPYWTTPKPVLTGRIHQWREFQTYIPNYDAGDTLYYRFTFISDSIQTNQEGWMLDDIELVVHTEDIQDLGSRNEINIHPNPANNVITVSAKTFSGEMEVSIYDILGQLCLQQVIDKNREEIDISSLGKGIYMVRVLSGNKHVVKRIIKN